MKPALAMLAAHEPEQDPRVIWAAQCAAEAGYDCSLLGFSHKRPQGEFTVGGYRIRRSPRRWPHSAQFIAHLADELPDVASLLQGAIKTLDQRASARHALFPHRFRDNVSLFNQSPLIVAIKRFANESLNAVGPSGERVKQFLRAQLMKPWVPVGIRIDNDQVPAYEPAATSAEGSTQTELALLQEARNDQRLAWMIVHVLSAAEQLLSEIDPDNPPALIHCHDMDTLLAGVMAKRRWGCRLIWDSHENWPLMDPDTDSQYQNMFLKLEKLLAHSVDYLVAVSGPLAEEIAERTGIANFIVVANAEIWRGPPSPAVEGAMSHLAAGRLRVLFQGSFAPERGLEQVLEAWVGVDSTRAALFLRGHMNEASAALRKLAVRLDLLEKSVYFLDPVSEEQLVSASVEADLGLIPYLKKLPGYRVACPNKLSQFLHAGVPVISNDLPFVKEVLETGACGVTYDSEIDGSFVAAINRVLDDPHLLRSWQENALKTAEHAFNWQVESRSLLEVYTKLIGSLNANTA